MLKQTFFLLILLFVSFIGFSQDDEPTQIENDSIIPIEQTMKELEIDVKQPLMTIKHGVMIVDVAQSPILSSGNALETLSKLPNISFNQTNNSFSFRGGYMKVKIDGRDLYMSEKELAEYLKSIPASDIKSIEIDANPSAKHDASGGSHAIVNIKTKKTTRQGHSLSAWTYHRQAKYYNQSSGIRGQYNTKKSRFLLSYSNGYELTPEQADIYTEFSSVNTKQDTRPKVKQNVNYVRALYEHDFSKSFLVINASANYAGETIEQPTKLGFYNSSSTLVSSLISQKNSTNNVRTFDVGAKYEINNDNSKITVKSDYFFYNIRRNSILYTSEIPSTNVYNDLQNNSPYEAGLSVSQIDYEVFLDSVSKLETGAKAIYQRYTSENDFYQIDNFNTSVFDTDKSGAYKSQDLVTAIFAQYSRQINKFGVVGGLRGEYNPLKGTDLKNNHVLKSDEFKIFPFVNTSYAPNNNHVFNLSYNRHISRTNFKDLMPFVYYIDQYSSIAGNPNLKSSFSHNIQFQYVLKGKYSFTSSYTIDQRAIYNVPILNDTATSTIQTKYNLKESNLATLSAYARFRPLSFWDIYVNALGMYRKVSDSSIQVDYNNYAGDIDVTTAFFLPKNYIIQLIGKYTTPSVSGVYKTDQTFNVDLAFQKSFLDGKLTTQIIGSDILKTYQLKNTSKIENQYSVTQQNIDTHWFRFGLIYNLSKGVKKQEHDNSDEILDEFKNRAQ